MDVGEYFITKMFSSVLLMRIKVVNNLNIQPWTNDKIKYASIPCCIIPKNECRMFNSTGKKVCNFSLGKTSIYETIWRYE